MSQVREKHSQAMDSAEEALRAQRLGQADRALLLNARAFELEQEAALLATNNGGSEPTQSVLLRSAATLALRCKRHRDAERLVAKALSGEPPSDVADELRDLLEEINFERHLDLRGITLSHDELQLSIAGAGVGFGFAPTEEFVRRIDVLQKLMYRTAEHKAEEPYRNSASPPKEFRDQLRVFMSVPRAASLAVTLRIASDKDQPELFPGRAADVIDELMTRLQAFNEGSDAELKQRITNASYYTNFVGLARQLAPSGTQVRQVGLTAMRSGAERKVALTRRREEIIARPGPAAGRVEAPEEPGEIILTGILKFADSTKPDNDSIKIEGTDGGFQTLRVPTGMMADIVRPLWEMQVTVRAERKRRHLCLLDIAPAETKEPEKSENGSR